MAENFRTAVTPAMARTMLTTFRDLDVSSEVPRITARALVLHRQSERQIPEEISAQLAASLPNGSLRRLAGDSPSLFVSDPEGDLRLFVDFLTNGEAPVEAPSARVGALSPGSLTPREIDVLRLVAGGETNSAVAHRLGISVHTVERHLANLYPKIGARGRTDAVAYALRRGIA
jgi:DNA-binding NarL/FixJ family response regulator